MLLEVESEVSKLTIEPEVSTEDCVVNCSELRIVLRSLAEDLYIPDLVHCFFPREAYRPESARGVTGGRRPTWMKMESTFPHEKAAIDAAWSKGLAAFLSKLLTNSR